MSSEPVQRQLTYGEKAVGINFNPSQNEEVQTCKEIYAEAIDQMHKIRESTEDLEVKRLTSIAITQAQIAQMCAVKAITWDL